MRKKVALIVLFCCLIAMSLTCFIACDKKDNIEVKVSSYQAHVFSGSSGRFVFCEKCKYRKLNDGGIIDIPNPCSTTPEILEDMEKIHEMLHNLNLEHRCC